MNITDETVDFIRLHRLDDVRQLALKGNRNPKVDLSFALDQIQGWQTARKKLPTWATTEGVVYPPHLNMEQCSSEATARYKGRYFSLSGLCHQATLFDLTGGFGVDFSLMSGYFAHAVYVERNPKLAEVATYNFRMLGLHNVKSVNADGVDYLLQHIPLKSSRNDDVVDTVVYLDPARRNTTGQKVFRIEDCTPCLLAIRNDLLQRADVVMIKFSPMLDWHEAVRQLLSDLPTEACLPSCEVHIISVKNECKELLIILATHRQHCKRPTKIVCVNDNSIFETDDTPTAPLLTEDDAFSENSCYLFVPNASVMKAGVFGQLSKTLGITMLDHDSHIYISSHDLPAFPGRRFKVNDIATMNKRELHQKLRDITQANVSVRNFPLTAEELRKRLKLKDGGQTYLFATTFKGRHLIFIATANLTSANN
ncbi:SAM-dependent methyltransferase [Hallella multisaccharivorax]|uniref:THUMP-like domain-containing protein n=1 Tax=Hallella multisaccharivorax TaxID=310514 RepID=UPI00361AA9D8